MTTRIMYTFFILGGIIIFIIMSIVNKTQKVNYLIDSEKGYSLSLRRARQINEI